MFALIRRKILRDFYSFAKQKTTNSIEIIVWISLGSMQRWLTNSFLGGSLICKRQLYRSPEMDLVE